MTCNVVAKMQKKNISALFFPPNGVSSSLDLILFSLTRIFKREREKFQHAHLHKVVLPEAGNINVKAKA